MDGWTDGRMDGWMDGWKDDRRLDVCIYVCMSACTGVHMYVCMHACMHAYMYIYMYEPACIPIGVQSVHVCVCACVCLLADFHEQLLFCANMHVHNTYVSTCIYIQRQRVCMCVYADMFAAYILEKCQGADFRSGRLPKG